jgi:hypothetical protein
VLEFCAVHSSVAQSRHHSTHEIAGQSLKRGDGPGIEPGEQRTGSGAALGNPIAKGGARPAGQGECCDSTAHRP